MDRLKKGRRPLRTIVTRVCNELAQEMEQGDSDRLSSKAKLDFLEETMVQLEEWDRKILNQLLEEGYTDQDQDDEYLTIQEYKEKFSVIKYKMNTFLNSQRPESPTTRDSNTTLGELERDKKRMYKLPKIELQKFNGDLKEWLGFWSQFQKIHLDEDLHDSDKFHYLVQSMVEGSRARELVTSYPRTNENYPKVISALKDRFGKEDLLVELYVRELTRLIISNANSREKIDLARMYDRLESQLRALESLGVTSDKNAAMLYPIVESSLPEELLRAWQRSTLSSQNVGPDQSLKSRLDCLMLFLKREVEGEERIALAQGGFEVSPLKRNRWPPKRFDKSEIPRAELPTATALFVGHRSTCIFCDKQHESEKCGKAQSLSMDEKREKVKEKGACFCCLRGGHSAKRCKTFVKCCYCSKRHFVLMCPELPKYQKTENAYFDDGKSSNGGPTKAVQSGLVCDSEILLQTLIVNLRHPDTNQKKRVRMLCDPGSQRSYVLRKTAEELGLKSSNKVKLCHLLFGGSKEVQVHQRHNVQVDSIYGDFSQLLEVLDHKEICGSISRMKKGAWLSELKEHGIWLNDVGEGTPQIEVLIGSDYYPKLLTGRSFHLQNGLTALETVFGWTLTGKVEHMNEESSSSIVTSMLVSHASVSELWDLEAIGIRDPVESMTKRAKEEATKQHFLKTVTRGEDGRYSVSLPWVEGVQKIPDNMVIAERHLSYTTMKLRSTGHYEEYENVFSSWLAEGIIEIVDEKVQNGLCHYLPHRAVIKPESVTTPIRPVFDASCKSSRAPSLNECLEKGPNLIELIPSLLLRFRENNIGVLSDIRKAFQMIEIKERDRDFLRFLWWEDNTNQKLKIFRHRRVVFGVISSPFLLGAVIECHLQKVEEGQRETAEKLKKSLYVDNCVTSVNSSQEYEDFKTQATSIMGEAKMQLRQWECSAKRVNGTDELPNTEQPTTSVLGLKWDKVHDTLSPVIKPYPSIERVTKRTILSAVQRVFDPIGFTCPVLLRPKLLLQRTWENKLGWDEELSNSLETEFRQWYEELEWINHIQIPRNVTGGIGSRKGWQLHTFCDASQDAYAAVVFLRISNDTQMSIHLLQAKSRVAPLKKATIPRLELLACTMASRLTKSVKEALSCEDVPTFYWSDSTTALAWISRNDDWGTFVGNRVREICHLTMPHEWRHVPGSMNPADLPSRGCNAVSLLKSRWWEGPEWLKAPTHEWPQGSPNVDETVVKAEKKRTTTTVSNLSNSQDARPCYVSYFSSYNRIVRMVAWMKRFTRNARQIAKYTGDLTAEEIKSAEDSDVDGPARSLSQRQGSWKSPDNP